MLDVSDFLGRSGKPDSSIPENGDSPKFVLLLSVEIFILWRFSFVIFHKSLFQDLHPLSMLKLFDNYDFEENV